MTIRNKLALAVMVAGLSSQVSAFELGEFNGTTFSVGGYIKGEGVFNDPDNSDTSFDATARQSRIGFKAAKNDVEGHKVSGYVEGDFYGAGANGSYDWRLRHAYIQVDNLTVGQTWNGQIFTTVPFDVEMIDFFSAAFGSMAGSGKHARPDVVLHYTLNGFRLTAQDPRYTDADIPDLVASYTHFSEGGSGFNIGIAGREVDTTPGVTTDSESDFGASISVAGRLKFGNTMLAAGAFTGEGNAMYAGWGNDVDDVTGELNTTTGFYAGISHKFNDKLRGNLRYGQLESDEVELDGEDTVSMTNVNLIYTYLPGLDFGIEWRDRNAATIPGIRDAGQQLEIMAMYKF